MAAIAVLGASAAVAYLARGDRFRLFTSEHAAHCWRAAKALALPSSSLRPVSVAIAGAGAGGTEVAIGYRLDRVLGGKVLELRCAYADGAERATVIELNGSALDAEALSRVNAEAAP